MALTAQQAEILRLLASNRLANPQSYVAGGLALNYKLDTPRLSRDIDIFHDTKEAMIRSWEMDRAVLEKFPRSEVGKAVMKKGGGLFKGSADELEAALAAGELEFHEGTIGGAWPRIIG